MNLIDRNAINLDKLYKNKNLDSDIFVFYPKHKKLSKNIIFHIFEKKIDFSKKFKKSPKNAKIAFFYIFLKKFKKMYFY